MPCICVQFYNSKVLTSETRNSVTTKMELFYDNNSFHLLALVTKYVSKIIYKVWPFIIYRFFFAGALLFPITLVIVTSPVSDLLSESEMCVSDDWKGVSFE